MKTSIRLARVLPFVFALVLGLTPLNPVLANEGDSIEFRLIGSINNQPLFQLNLSTPEDSEFTLVVLDEFNNVLHRDILKGGNSSRKFLLNTEELGDAQVRFQLSGKTLEKPVVFEVNNQSRLVQDVVISRVSR